MANSLLIIDDDPEVIQLITELLSYKFDKISYSCSVDDALSKLKNEVFNLILMDVKIQERNGAEIILFMRENPANDNNSAPIIIVSATIDSGFIERNYNRYAGILIKPFDNDEMINLVSYIILKNSAKDINDDDDDEAIKQKRLSKDSSISYITCSIPFPMSQLEVKVNKILDQVRGNTKLKRLFNKLNIDRNPTSIAQARIGLLVNICAGIAAKLDWSSDTTIEKFVYAAFLHDMALASRPDLAKISSLAKLESMKNELSEEDYNLVFEHPNIAANSLLDYKIISSDVVSIIRQHHELPGGNGFPAKIPYNKITPLSTIFIVALDLTEYIMNDLNWKIETYLNMNKEKYKGIYFTKSIMAIKNMQ